MDGGSLVVTGQTTLIVFTLSGVISLDVADVMLGQLLNGFLNLPETCRSGSS